MIKKTMILTVILFAMCSNLQAQDLTRGEVIKLIAIATKPLNLSGVKLGGVNLSNLDLKGANFSGAYLSETNFSGANINKLYCVNNLNCSNPKIS